MKTIEYRTFKDKAEWGKGPWVNEPDKVQWQDEATSLPCLIVRAPVTGALCGYVGVPPSHPLYQKEYSDAENEVSVHGGLTFSGKCMEDGDEESVICHKVEDGEDDNVWWLGFDCAHAFDLAPRINMTRLQFAKTEEQKEALAKYTNGLHYRDIAYVKDQCADLAKQLKEIGDKAS